MDKAIYTHEEMVEMLQKVNRDFGGITEDTRLDEDWEEDHFRHNTHSHTESANTLEALKNHPSFRNAPDSLKKHVNALHNAHKQAAMANKQAVMRHSRQMAGQNPDTLKSNAHSASNKVAGMVYGKSSSGFIQSNLPKRSM